MMWNLFKTKLNSARSILAEAYKLPTGAADEALFKAFDAIDEALKIADGYVLSNKEYSSKYRGYGLVGDEIDDHTSVWGGAGPDCMSEPE